MTTIIGRKRNKTINCEKCKHFWFPLKMIKVNVDKKRDAIIAYCQKCGGKSVTINDFTFKEMIKSAEFKYKRWKEKSKKKYAC